MAGVKPPAAQPVVFSIHSKSQDICYEVVAFLDFHPSLLLFGFWLNNRIAFTYFAGLWKL